MELIGVEQNEQQVKRIGTEEKKKENVKYIGNKIFENKTMVMKRETPVGLGTMVLSYMGLAYLMCLLFFPLIVNLQSTWSKLVLQGICLIFFLCFIYIPVWNVGVRDATLVKQEKFSYDSNRPLIAGLVCVIPSMVSYFMLFVAKLFNIQFLYNLYKVFNVHFLGLLLVLSPDPYVTNIENWHLVLFFALPFLFTLCCITAYNLGYQNKKILSKDLFAKKVDVEKL